MNGLRNIPDLEIDHNYEILRRVWFPIVLRDAANFHVTMLFSACHYASLAASPTTLPDPLILKQKAIAAINEGIGDRSRSSTDAFIGAVAKMAFYESMFGDLEAYNVHMKGLKRMIEIRGGLQALGLNGTLADMCLWTDERSWRLNNTKRHLLEDTRKESPKVKVEEVVRPV